MIGVLGVDTDSDAASRHELIAVDSARLPHLADQVLRNMPSVIAGLEVHQHDVEFIATDPCNRIAGTQCTFKARGYLLQYLVADFVPKTVVDLLELVEVDIKQGQLPTVAFRGTDTLGQAIAQQEAIRQTGQTVMLGLVDQLVLLLLQFVAQAQVGRDVTRCLDDTRQLAVVIEPRRRREFDIVRIAILIRMIVHNRRRFLSLEHLSQGTGVVVAVTGCLAVVRYLVATWMIRVADDRLVPDASGGLVRQLHLVVGADDHDALTDAVDNRLENAVLPRRPALSIGDILDRLFQRSYGQVAQQGPDDQGQHPSGRSAEEHYLHHERIETGHVRAHAQPKIDCHMATMGQRQRTPEQPGLFVKRGLFIGNYREPPLAVDGKGYDIGMRLGPVRQQVAGQGIVLTQQDLARHQRQQV